MLDWGGGGGAGELAAYVFNSQVLYFVPMATATNSRRLRCSSTVVLLRECITDIPDQ